MEVGDTETARRLYHVKDHVVRDTITAKGLANHGLIDRIFLGIPVQNPDGRATNQYEQAQNPGPS